MIVEFSVQNFRSIKELQTISFVASGLKSSKEHSEVDLNNMAVEGGMNLFKTIGIYGANASGKSNIFKALDLFIKTITREPSSISNMAELCDPFLFQESAHLTESYFQIVLIINNTKFRYGLTVKKNNTQKEDANQNYSNEIISGEWLFGTKEKNMRALFERNLQNIENKLPNKERVPKHLSFDHSLFITHAAAFDNDGECNLIRNYLRNMTTSNFQISHDKFRWMSIANLKQDVQPSKKQEILNLLSVFNLSYQDISLDKENENLSVAVFPQDKIYLTKNNVQLNLKKNESAGTQKLFDLAGLLLRAFSLPQSAFIILDEIDSNFHPSLLIKLIGLFNDPRVNKSKSQLLFTSHDTNLMSPSIMRRDQFYFTEKNIDHSTRLYSLAELRGIRNDADFAKQYLAGIYGALPILKEYNQEGDLVHE